MCFSDLPKVYTKDVIKDCICIYDDKKEKRNSFEGNIILEVDFKYSSIEIKLVAYAENEEELLKELKADYTNLINKFEEKYTKD